MMLSQVFRWFYWCQLIKARFSRFILLKVSHKTHESNFVGGHPEVYQSWSLTLPSASDKLFIPIAVPVQSYSAWHFNLVSTHANATWLWTATHGAGELDTRSWSSFQRLSLNTNIHIYKKKNLYTDITGLAIGTNFYSGISVKDAMYTGSTA